MERKSDTIMFETPLKSTNKRLTEFTTPNYFSNVEVASPLNLISNDNCDQCSLKVAVRVRPFNSRELNDTENRCVISMNENETTVCIDRTNKHNFFFDYSFWSFDETSSDYASQKFVYEKMGRPLLDQVLLGYNACLFAYGQTSTGKSYCMIGDHGNEGIIPQFCKDLFDKINPIENKDINVTISFFEIYNEKIHDLLKRPTASDASKKSNLRVREDPVTGPYVVELSSFPVQSYGDILSWIDIGNKKRATAATEYNQQSSRSHSVFTITVSQVGITETNGDSLTSKIVSKMNLVDLAGSERLQTFKASENKLRETANINKSLLTLGKVISTLSLSGKRSFVPYRESILTWLLKESLGGNSKTSMLATISPSSICVEETLHTLRYAKQARSILNSARINEDPTIKIIQALKAQIEALKKEKMNNFKTENIELLKNQLSQKENEIEKLKKLRNEELEAAKLQLEESKLLTKCETELPTDMNVPGIVNLNLDAQLSEIVIFPLKRGHTYVGSKISSDCQENEKGRGGNSGQQQFIHLVGSNIAQDHCYFLYDEDSKVVKLIAYKNVETFVNGNLVEGEIILRHNDRVIFGQTHFFRFNELLNKNTEKGMPKSIYDFQFALSELQNTNKKKIESTLIKQRQELDEAVSELKAKKSLLEKKAETELTDLGEHLKSEKMRMQMAIDSFRKNKKIADEQSNKMKLFLKECENNASIEIKDVLSGKPAASKLTTYLNDKKLEISKKYGNVQSQNSAYKDILELNDMCMKIDLPYKFEIANDLVIVRNINSELVSFFMRSSLVSVKNILIKDKENIGIAIKANFIQLVNLIDSTIFKKDINKNDCQPDFTKGVISEMDKQFDITNSFADRVLYLLTNIMFYVHESYSDIFENESFPTQLNNKDKLYLFLLKFNSLKSDLENFVCLHKNTNSPSLSEINTNILEGLKSMQNNVQVYFKACCDDNKLVANDLVLDVAENIFTFAEIMGMLAIKCDMHLHEISHEIDDPQLILFDSNIKVHFLKGCDLFINYNLKSLIKALEENDTKLLEDTNSFSTQIQKQKLDLLLNTRKVVYSSILLLRKMQAIKNEMSAEFNENKSTQLESAFYSFLLRYGHSTKYVRLYKKIYHCIINLMENVKGSLTGDDEIIVGVDVQLISGCLDRILSISYSILSLNDAMEVAKPASKTLKMTELLNDSQIELLEVAVAELQDATFNMSQIMDA